MKTGRTTSLSRPHRSKFPLMRKRRKNNEPSHLTTLLRIPRASTSSNKSRRRWRQFRRIWTRTVCVFAYGRKFAIRGAARFETKEAMWSYLKGEDTKVHFDIHGHRIYINRDVRKTLEDEAKDKAVRKLVWAIIEEEGGDGATTKSNIESNYKRCIV